MNRQTKLCRVMLVVAISVVLGFSPVLAAYPDKPLEFVVHNPPGAGTDLFARGIVDILTREKIVTSPVVILNKPGGSGAVATSYVMQKKGDPYTILTAATAVFSTMVKRGISLGEFTPLCRMAIDPSVILVRGVSPYKEVGDVIAEAKKARKGLKMGIASIGGTDHMIGNMLQRATGAEFNMISFKGGNEATTALLGGHVDFTVSNPGEAAGLIEAGKLRVLATSMDRRLPYYPNVPRLQEKGLDVVFMQIRGFFLPKDVAPEIVQYWETAFEKLHKTNSWKEFVKKDYLVDAFLKSGDFKSWLTSEFVVYEKNLRELDQLQK